MFLFDLSRDYAMAEMMSRLGPVQAASVKMCQCASHCDRHCHLRKQHGAAKVYSISTLVYM